MDPMAGACEKCWQCWARLAGACEKCWECWARLPGAGCEHMVPINSSLVAPRRARAAAEAGGIAAIEMLFRARGPLRATKGLIFLERSKTLERCERAPAPTAAERWALCGS